MAAPPPARGRGAGAAREPRLVGRYRLVSEQGTGLFGTVWLAEDTTTRRRVAVRLLPRELTDLANVAETIRRRARVVVEASRAHPGLVRVLEYGTDADGTLFAVMERVEGKRLDRFLARRPLSVLGALRLAIELGAPVEALHNLGLLHGGLRPRNVAVAGGRVTLMDVETIALRDAPALQPLVVARAPAEYLAPEQIQGRPVTEKTDVYAFALTVHALVARRPPFQASSRAAVLDQHLSAPPPPLRRGRRPVPGVVEAALVAALQKAPEQRPFMAKVLNHLASEAGSGAARRWKHAAALAAGIVVALAAAAPVAWSLLTAPAPAVSGPRPGAPPPAPGPSGAAERAPEMEPPPSPHAGPPPAAATAPAASPPPRATAPAPPPRVPGRPAPLAAAPGRQGTGEPDPSAVIDWLLKGRKDD